MWRTRHSPCTRCSRWCTSGSVRRWCDCSLRGRVWLLGQVSSQAEFDELRASSDGLIVCDVFSPAFGPCLPLRVLASDYPTVRFVSVNLGSVVVLDTAGVPLAETSEPTFALVLVRVGGFPSLWVMPSGARS